VKMLVFNSMPLDTTGQPDYETEWLKTRKKRQTLYTFTDAVITPEKFFLFKVRNVRPSLTVTKPPTDMIRIKHTGVFFYGNQGKIASLSLSLSLSPSPPPPPPPPGTCSKVSISD
jgi:hypothetical protein